MLDMALAYHKRGFVPVPLRQGGKHLDIAAMGYEPHHFRTRQKRLKELMFTSLCYYFSQRPPNTEELRAWFSRFEGNIGLVTGCNGLVVLDFDRVEHFEAWKATNGDLVSRAAVARTPNGWHIYLRMASPIVTSSMYSGARRIGHVKALGGYVVAAPSEVSDPGAYAWRDHARPDADQLATIESLEEIGLAQVSPLKRAYDRLRHRGYFELQ